MAYVEPFQPIGHIEIVYVMLFQPIGQRKLKRTTKYLQLWQCSNITTDRHHANSQLQIRMPLHKNWI